MWNLVAEKDKRKYDIIECLFHATAPITTRELAAHTGSSIRVIKYDLEELKEELASFDGGLLSSAKGFLLELPPHIGLDSFQRKIFDDTPAFHLLEMIFFNESLTSIEIENALYLSSSTLKRLTRKLNEALKDYGLEVAANPYRLVGEEFLIVHFYALYFKERYSLHRWPFKNVSLDALYNVFFRAFDHLGLQTTYLDIGMLCIFFSIEVVRKKNGYRLPINNNDSENAKQPIEQVRAFFQAALSQHLQPEEASSYTDIFTQWLYRFPVLLGHDFAGEFPEFADELESVEAIFDDLTEKFDLIPDEHRYLIYEICVMLRIYSFYPTYSTGKNYLLFPPRDIFLLNYYEREFPSFYNLARQHLTSMCEKRSICLSQSAMDSILYLLLSRWDQLTRQLFFKFSSCRILVYSHQSFTHATNLANELITKLDRSVIVEAYPHQLISVEQLATKQFDILVSTVTLDFAIKQPISYVHRTGLQLSLERLKEMIALVKEQNIAT